jgi:hypothetical protein
MKFNKMKKSLKKYKKTIQAQRVVVMIKLVQRQMNQMSKVIQLNGQLINS